MKKMNYSSQSLRHIISSMIVIVISLFIAACFLVPASMMKIIFFVLFIIGVIIALYLLVFLIVDTFLDDLEHEYNEKQKHHTTWKR